MNLEGYEHREPTNLHDVDKWILSRLARTEQTVREGYENYDIQSACQALYQFFWSELCDWYIEISKDRLADADQRQTPQWVLVTCLDAFLRMMHPVMPHITEEVFAQLPLPEKPAFLMSAPWPTNAGKTDEQAEAKVESWIETTRALRALRAELGIAAMKQIPVAYLEGELGEGARIVASQAWVAEIKQGRPEGKFVSTSIPGVDLHLPTEGLIDEAAELQRISSQIEKTQIELAKLEQRLSNPSFVERAKPEVVEKERASARDLQEVLEKLQSRKALFGG
jgi:valyl-tRNA synthetase